jgi:Raf kinase inhibitor-like YbhB/YbcL family protein
LVWGEVPVGTVSVALLVEDPDAPAPHPLVHALVWNMPPDERHLAEGAIAADGDGAPDGRDVGRNSYYREGWLPPDPPSGHGSHDYVFQVFALSATPDIGHTPRRASFIEALKGNVLAAGILVGTYSRGEAAPMSPEGAGLSPA